MTKDVDYGEMRLSPVKEAVNRQNGQFLKGHVPANKGKRWKDYMSKRGQRRARKGWKNLDLHRNKNGRADNAGRCRKAVIAVMDDGSWCYFPYLAPAAEWIGGNRENVGRCCRANQSKAVLHNTHGKPTGKVNTDHHYKGVRFYFETDDIWTTKIKK